MQISVGKTGDNVNFRATEVSSIQELAKLITTGPYCLGTYRDNYRNKSNFIQCQAIALDFDEGLTIDAAVEEFKDYRHIIAPSRSHQKEKNGLVCDRFRVILFTAQPITDEATYYATWFDVAEAWPQLDPMCKDPSRMWYASTSIYHTNIEGGFVKPVAPPPKPEPADTVDLSTLLPGDRGKLSRSTQDFLENGIDQGGRNHSTFKAAKEFQQNLYTYDEAVETIVTALQNNGTIAPDFTEREVRATVKSAFNSEPKHEPRIEERAFKLMKIGDVYRDTTKVEWLVDHLFTVGGMSLMSADPKAGKSTLVRQLIRDVLRGTDFLGRRCKQGMVHYYAIEEQIQVINASFKRLEVRPDEPLLIHVGDPLTDNTLKDFRDILNQYKPALAVIDTLFDFLDVESENNYKEIKRELRRLRLIARETGTHILLVHHNSKAGKDDKRRGNRAILGSQAIAGAMDTIAVIEVDGKDRLISTTGREIKGWRNRYIVFNEKDCTYTLGKEHEDFY